MGRAPAAPHPQGSPAGWTLEPPSSLGHTRSGASAVQTQAPLPGPAPEPPLTLHARASARCQTRWPLCVASLELGCPGRSGADCLCPSPLSAPAGGPLEVGGKEGPVASGPAPVACVGIPPPTCRALSLFREHALSMSWKSTLIARRETAVELEWLSFRSSSASSASSLDVGSFASISRPCGESVWAA